ncbi:Copper-transporting ATPase [Venturia nashicola]|uniref:Copper-transporting ATPase n=1 Tax=Venturia nashicola TaxID=86259 RepID=A0A4Z1NN55_9PEZI|nr:Copper-transporting ATPase [Venturia nashicola]
MLGASLTSLLLFGLFYAYHAQDASSFLPQSLNACVHLPAPLLRNESEPEIEKRAYATLLTTRITDPDQEDLYFTAVRVLSYQLLHQPETRTDLSIPFVVFVTPHVSAEKQAILADEGATVVTLELLEPETNWVNPGEARFIDQFTKLRLFEQTQYEQILYLDADMLLTRSLDAIWNEPEAQQSSETLPAARSWSDLRLTGTSPPCTYSIVGVSDTGGSEHPFPPPTNLDMNGGFMLLRPSLHLFSYYVSILNTPHSFDSNLMEQALLNHAHRPDGRMPWKSFEPGRWNVNWPRLRDIEGGAASLHDKFWEGTNEVWIERVLVEKWWRAQGRMEGFWVARRGDEGGEDMLEFKV